MGGLITFFGVDEFAKLRRTKTGEPWTLYWGIVGDSLHMVFDDSSSIIKHYETPIANITPPVADPRAFLDDDDDDDDETFPDLLAQEGEDSSREPQEDPIIKLARRFLNKNGLDDNSSGPVGMTRLIRQPLAGHITLEKL